MSLEDLKRKRAAIKGKLTRFKNQFANYNKATGLGSWVLKLEKIEPLYSEFDDVQTEIHAQCGEESEELELQERDDFEFTYFELATQIREFIERNRRNDRATTSFGNQSNNELPTQVTSLNELASLLSANTIASNLPTIKIPQFDGSHKDWVKFRDSFKTMVHEKSILTSIQKFHLLR